MARHTYSIGPSFGARILGLVTSFAMGVATLKALEFGLILLVPFFGFISLYFLYLVFTR